MECGVWPAAAGRRAAGSGVGRVLYILYYILYPFHRTQQPKNPGNFVGGAASPFSVNQKLKPLRKQYILSLCKCGLLKNFNFGNQVLYLEKVDRITWKLFIRRCGCSI